MTVFLVVLQPSGRRVEIEPGADLLTAAQRAGVDLVAACGGVGICGTCRIRLLGGELNPPTGNEREHLSADELLQGYRLACQAQPRGNVQIEIPPESLPVGQRLQVAGEAGALELDPVVTAVDLALNPPTLDDLRADQQRAAAALAGQGIEPLTGSLAALGGLSPVLRSNDWRARLALRRDGSRADLAAALPLGAPLLGLAVDIGSTKLAAYLVDLERGVTLAQAGRMNPQIAYGEDVVSRIAFANRSDHNRQVLQSRLVEALNEMTARLCAEVGVQPEWIADAVVVGNTAMHHFFCGLPVEQLGAAPYVAAVSAPLSVAAAEVGLRLAGGAAVYLPANIAGYVGADHTAALAAMRLDEAPEPRLLIDIGTNTEVSLAVGGALYSCSCASGPAFEGAHIRDGMRAAAGAVESMRIAILSSDQIELKLHTIDDTPAVGICGSGILQAVAELRATDILDHRGTFDIHKPGVRRSENGVEFLLIPAAQTGHGRDIVITRRDVHEVQLAKAAIRAGIDILLHTAGIHAGSVGEWIVAGAFGTYIDLRSAQQIGMFPPQAVLDRFRQVGNAAGQGARGMLFSRRMRSLAADLAARAQYIELTTHPRFSEVYIGGMGL